jgi:branched-chain amino acid transport system ATP-binding protein
MGILLEVKKLNKYFGGLAAISELDLNVLDSEILGLIGPNGAGKTTLFNVISGFFPPTSGKVLLNGRNITWMKAHEITHLGISRTFQATNLFMRLSVLENVFTGYHLSYKTKIWKRLLRSPSAHEEENRHQRILGICMALATHPRLLLLDEPVTGMNATETQSMIDLIRQIREKGVTIVLVEHDMKAVMNLCDRIVVLNYGQKIAEGLPGEIRENKRVIEAYLGRERGK